MSKNENVIKSDKKFNWILWSVIGVLVIAAIVGTIFIVKAVIDNDKNDDDRITMFDSYDQLPYSYFLKEYTVIDPTVTTTTGSVTTTTEEVIDVADDYYLFIYDGTKSCSSYGCSTAFTDNIGYEKFLDEMKDVLDKAIAEGIQVYVADVSLDRYTGYEAGVISSEYNYTSRFNNNIGNDGTTSITIAGPALIKVEGSASNYLYSVTVYKSGVENLYRDIKTDLEKFEGWDF